MNIARIATYNTRMTHHQTQQRLQQLLVVLLAATVVSHVSAATSSSSCATTGECCDVCGADSYRCARGPCSSSFITKGFFSVSAPTTSLSFWDVVFVFYGTVPYVAPILLAVEFIVHRRSWTRVFAFLFIPIVAVINAVILVKSLGNCDKCSRPCGSCVSSKGMPSGHATNAIGLALWIILESLRGVGKPWSPIRRVLTVCAAVLLFVPVPYSRVYLGDHTSLQVTIGSANGLVLGALYFCVVRFYFGRRLDGASRFLERKCCGLVVHNDFYQPPPTAPIELALLEPQEQPKDE